MLRVLRKNCIYSFSVHTTAHLPFSPYLPLRPLSLPSLWFVVFRIGSHGLFSDTLIPVNLFFFFVNTFITQFVKLSSRCSLMSRRSIILIFVDKMILSINCIGRCQCTCVYAQASSFKHYTLTSSHLHSHSPTHTRTHTLTHSHSHSHIHSHTHPHTPVT